MLEYLVRLPLEVLGEKLLGYLELIDIVRLENAAASHKWQQFLQSILPYCPPINIVSDLTFNIYTMKNGEMAWFKKRRCRVQLVRIGVKLLSEVNFDYSNLEASIELYLEANTTPGDIVPLHNPKLINRIARIHIAGKQDPAVMEVLFSLLDSVHSLNIESPNLSLWMGHIKKIGTGLLEMRIKYSYEMIKIITEYCPYLEKLSLSMEYSIPVYLHSIASKCRHLRSLNISLLYISTAEADAALTAFAEKCPQLEELTLHCYQLTDQSVIALAQHCSRLKKLKLLYCKLTATSLIALSEHGLPVEELEILPWIPIPSAEIAAQCAHALSRIHELSTPSYIMATDDVFYVAQYMTGLRELNLGNSEDPLESLTIGSYTGSSITPQQLSELIAGCNQLYTLRIHQTTCTSVEILVPVKLARNCPHLREITLDCRSKFTEEGMLSLAAHCRQLQKINIPYVACTEETVRQLAQHCRRLTKLLIGVHFREGEIVLEYRKDYDVKEIRALRAQYRELISHRNNNTCCLIM